MKSAALIRILATATLLSPACTSMASPTLASKMPTSFPVTRQDAETNSQGSTAGLPSQDDSWEFSVNPYLWATSMKGKTSVKGVSANVDATYSEIIKNTDIGGMVIVEARQGKTIFRLDQEYLAVSDEPKSGGTKADVTSTLYSAMFTAGRVFGEGSEAPEVFVGARYWRLDGRVKIRSGGTTIARGSGSQAWLDPIVGGRKRWELGGPWGLVALGNFGGFGIGTASDSTWGATLMATRTTESGGKFLVGWRHLAVRNSRGSGADEFKYNIRLTGPIFGWSFRF